MLTVKRHRTVGAQRRSRGGQLRLLFAALVCLLVAATFLMNVVTTLLAQRLPMTVDLTANAAYQVGEETRALLQRLDRDVEITVIAADDRFTGSAYLIQAQRMIEQYPQLSPRVTLTYVDFVVDPTFAARFADLTLSEGDVLVMSGDRVRQIRLVELFNMTQTSGGGWTIHSSRAEEAVSSAILYVTSDEPVRVAVLVGSGMAAVPAFARLLVTNNYELAEVNLATDALDDAYDVALLLAPRIDLSEDALGKLDAFLYNEGVYGKTLFYTADVAQEELPNVEAFLGEWGLVVGDGAVFETVATRTYQYQPYYPVADYVDSTYREQLMDPTTPVLMPVARPLTVLFEAQDGRFNEVLLAFSETSGVRPAEAVDGFSVEEATRWGPLPAFVLSSRRIYGTVGVTQFRSNVVVSASTAMLDTFSIENTSFANAEYLVNLLNTLSERTDVVSIPPKSLAGEALALSTAQGSRLGILLAGVLPVAILATGIAIWLVRRYQ